MLEHRTHLFKKVLNYLLISIFIQQNNTWHYSNFLQAQVELVNPFSPHHYTSVTHYPVTGEKINCGLGELHSECRKDHSAQGTGYERERNKAQGTGMRYGQNLDTHPLQDYEVFTKGKIKKTYSKSM